MNNLQFPKVSKSPPHFLDTPFDESIVELQLQRFESYFNAIIQRQHKKGEQIHKQIRKDIELLPAQHRKKGALKGLLFNMKGLMARELNDHKKALKCFQKAEEEVGKSHGLDLARIALSRSLVLSDLGESNQANAVAREALSLFTQNSAYIKNIKINLKAAEINVTMLMYLAVELKKVESFSQSKLIFKQGYILAANVLGPHHKSTRALKLQVKERKIVKEEQKKRHYSEYQSVKSRLAHDKCRQEQRIKQDSRALLLQNSKEKEIHRIYQGRMKTEGWNTDESDFLTTLWKLKHLYRKCTTEQSSHSDIQPLESLKEKHYHVKARELLLRGRTLNKEILLSRGNSQLEPLRDLEKTQIDVSLGPSIEESDKLVQPLAKGIQPLLSKTEGNNPKGGDDCQLI